MLHLRILLQNNSNNKCFLSKVRYNTPHCQYYKWNHSHFDVIQGFRTLRCYATKIRQAINCSFSATAPHAIAKKQYNRGSKLRKRMNGADEREGKLNFVLFGWCLFNYTSCMVSLSGELHAGLSSAFTSSMMKPAWQIHQIYCGVSKQRVDVYLIPRVWSTLCITSQSITVQLNPHDCIVFMQINKLHSILYLNDFSYLPELRVRFFWKDKWEVSSRGGLLLWYQRHVYKEHTGLGDNEQKFWAEIWRFDVTLRCYKIEYSSTLCKWAAMLYSRW